MKAKMVLPLVAVCLCLLLPPVASAQTINLTLYYDWDRDKVFSSTSLSVNLATMTFTTGDGNSGDVMIVLDCVTLIFRTGCCPNYTGPLVGFMDCKVGSCTSDPGYWYIGPATGVEFLQPGDRKSDGS